MEAIKQNEQAKVERKLDFWSSSIIKSNIKLEEEKNQREKIFWEKIFNYYAWRDSIYSKLYFNSLKKDKIKFLKKNEDKIKENFRFSLKCVDYLIFNSLLKVTSDLNIRKLLKIKINNIFIPKDLMEEDINNIDWITKALSVNINMYDKNIDLIGEQKKRRKG